MHCNRVVHEHFDDERTHNNAGVRVLKQIVRKAGKPSLYNLGSCGIHRSNGGKLRAVTAVQVLYFRCRVSAYSVGSDDSRRKVWDN